MSGTRRHWIEHIDDHVIAEPLVVDGGTGGNGQHGLRMVGMQSGYVAWQLGIAGQSHIVGERHGQTIAITHDVVGHARRCIEHDAPKVGMVAGPDRHRHGVVGSESRSEQENTGEKNLSRYAKEKAA